jgi:hypothetical protein
MLPSRLAYQTKIEPAAAKSYRANIAPQNGTDGYSAGNTIIFNIPTRNNLCMVPTESYLKFKPEITTGPTAAGPPATGAVTYNRFDSCGAHAFIRKIRVLHGSNVLEEIENYEVLAKIICDMQMSSDATRGKYTILAGTDAKYVLPAATALTSVVAVNRGALIPNIATGATTIAASTTITGPTYCLNLFSIMGTLCNEKYFPLFACTSAPIRLEITLAPTFHNVVCTNILSTFKLNDVEYVMNAIELSDSAIQIIQSSLQGNPLQFTVTDYKNYNWSGLLANGGSQLAIPIPAKLSSLKSIIIAARDGTAIGSGSATYYPISCCTFNLTSYTFRIGPNTMPAKPPSSNGEFFAEALKAMGSMSDVHYTPDIDYDSYRQASCVTTTETDAVVGTVNSGSFYVGLDLENYATADKSSIFAGYNSNTEDIYYYPVFGAQAVGTIRFDAFAMYDAVLVFENNTCFARN